MESIHQMGGLTHYSSKEVADFMNRHPISGKRFTMAQVYRPDGTIEQLDTDSTAWPFSLDSGDVLCVNWHNEHEAVYWMEYPRSFIIISAQ